MNELDLWRLADTLTLVQAAALIADVRPSLIFIRDRDAGGPYRMHTRDEPEWDIEEENSNFQAALHALKNAALAKRLKADIRCTGQYTHVRMVGNESKGYWEPLDDIDVAVTMVARDDLVAWLESRGFREGFFFERKRSDLPSFLDHNHPHFSSKLAAAVTAWLEVSADSRYRDNGKTVKQNLEAWLTAHAAQFNLLKDDGDINTDAISNQVAKVANWQTGGGAPKTPGG